ncbi:MAG: oligopeptidase A [Proteobacteria bacterium]|nr:MAG: oligopeptidase A [Pseudomonadota bacterium]QKK10839.1 MAG: oligopeptidase A [Pseudomonadota bacterium]
MPENPLLEFEGLPPFSRIKPEHIEPAIDLLLKENRQRIASLVKGLRGPTWTNFIEPLLRWEDRLERVWSPVSHLNSVANSEAWRAAYNNCLPKLSLYASELGQHEGLYNAYRALAEGAEYATLNPAQRKLIDNALRDFRLSGIELAEKPRTRYRNIMQELTASAARFEENLLDATNAWRRLVTNEAELAGLPATAVAQARERAEHAGEPGWLFTLEFPSYIAVITHADHRPLREATYEAYVTRASDQGPHAGRWDNGPVMERLLQLRHELAQLLGFSSYAERSLATKMAASPEQVLEFLTDLAERSLPVAHRDFDEIVRYARDTHRVTDLAAWDIAYYAEKLRKHKFDISQEELKPYFPEPRVVQGLFAVIERLYGIRLVAIEDVDVWHDSVRYFEVRDIEDRPCGGVYVDLYARPKKRGGAWMDECVRRFRHADGDQLPVAYVTCNFSQPGGDHPALFSHEEVLTLFHEFGHALHHLLTQIDFPPVGGINGVPWDAVELPSQLMENWCWEEDALAMISGHYQTEQPLPPDLLKRMKAARNFQSGMQMVRQLEFAIFDFRLHYEYDPAKGGRVYELLDAVRRQVAVIQPPAYNRFPHSFAHIFAGGYAAGYYSYKWAEVLSSDVFSAFEERGVFDAATGRRFLATVLEQGGSRDPLELFVEFRGREPQIDALLRHSGIL